MATFNFIPLERFIRGQTSIRRPREFAYFSYNGEHELRPLSTESLCYYYPPTFDTLSGRDRSFDLSVGFHDFVQRDDGIDEHLDGLLDTLQAHEELLLDQAQNGKGNVADVRLNADVITWRGMMTKILSAPFDEFDEIDMNATCYQGTIFIEQNHAAKEADRAQQKNRPCGRNGIPQEMMQYWGYKFETLSVLEKPWAEVTREDIESRGDKTVNSNAQYCSIVRTGIGNTSLILAGEVDAVLGGKPDQPDQIIPWIELKTSQELQADSQSDLSKFERKLLRYWAQSFLLGVPTIIVGFRSPDGFLTKILELETQKLPQQVKNSSRAWDGNLCINFTAGVLDFIKETIVGDGVWRISRTKRDRVIRIFRIEESGTGDIVKQSFKVHREKLRAAEIAAALGNDHVT